MYIEFLKLKRFKKFADSEWSFATGLNVIKGKNEQGKSSLASALIAGLFYNPKLHSKDKVMLNKSWHDEKLYEINIEFSGKEKKYYLHKDFEKKAVLLRDKNKENQWDDFAEVSKIIAAETGLSTPELYAATACVMQNQVAEIDTGKKHLENSLQTLITAGGIGANVLEVMRDLDKSLKEYQRGLDRPVKNPGIIKEVNDRLAVTKAEMENRRNTVQKIEQLKRENQKLEQEGKTASEELAQKNKLKIINSEYREKMNRLSELKQKAGSIKSTLEKLAKANQDIEQIKAQLGQFSHFAGRNLRRDEVNFERLQEKAQEVPEIKLSSKNLSLISWLIAGVLAIVGIGTLLFNAVLGSVILGVAVIVIMLAIYWRFQQRPEKTIALKQKADNARNELEKLKAEINVSDLTDLRNKIEIFENLAGDLRDNESLKKGLVRDKNEQQLTGEYQTLLMEMDKTEVGITPEIKNSILEAAEFNELVSRIDILEKDIQAKRENFKENLREINVHQKNEEGKLPLVELDEQSEQLQAELAAVREEEMVLKTIQSNLLEAKQRVSKSSKEILKESLQKLLPLLTEGKYKKVAVENDLTFSVYSDEAGEQLVPEKHLSRGTIDQFYLAVRFAFVDLISEQKNPPIILDDPFVSFDENRKEAALKLLKERSRTQQIFLLTCSNDYDKFADRTITL